MAASAWAVFSPAISAHAEVIRRQLDSGLILLVQENAASPAVAAVILVRVGSRWEREETAGISNLLQNVLVKGTATRTALAIADEAERMGGSLNASGDVDYSEIRGTALARHWRGLLGLMADVALNPALPPEEIDNERRTVGSGLRIRRDQPFQFTYDALMARLFPGHPYGVPILGRDEVVARLDREALLDRAFGPKRRRKTAERLREGRLPAEGLALSIRADDGELSGTVRLWNVEAGSAGPALLLGPIAIEERFRDHGIGSALMQHAIAEAKALGHRAIVLVGDEPYYSRVGFKAVPKGRAIMPGPVDYSRLLVAELVEGAFENVSGTIRPDWSMAKA